MKKYMILLAVPIILFACTTQESQTIDKVDETVSDGVFIHISKGYENPQKVLMALQLASLFSDSHDVAVFCDLEGVKLLTKDSEDITMENYTSAKESLKILTSNKALIMACPMCVKAAGLTADDLMEGVIIAEKEKFFAFTKGRIITLDY